MRTYFAVLAESWLNCHFNPLKHALGGPAVIELLKNKFISTWALVADMKVAHFLDFSV